MPVLVSLLTLLTDVLNLSTIPDLRQVAAQYFEVFLETMQREWFGIDRLRLDKFLMLVRKFVWQLFVYLQASAW